MMSAKRQSQALPGKDTRARLHELDAKVCRLLMERFGRALELGKIKKKLGEEVRDKSREKEVLAKVSSVQCRFLSKEVIHKIYFEVMKAARHLEELTTANYPLRPVQTEEREPLELSKREHRNRIDELDAEIVRVLDERLALTSEVKVLPEITDVDGCEAETLRQSICELPAMSDMKQSIWDVFCSAFGRGQTFVASPASVFPGNCVHKRTSHYAQ